MCPCHDRKTHYPMLEKPDVQRIAMSESQRKQCELSDHGTPSKTLFLIKKNSNNRG